MKAYVGKLCKRFGALTIAFVISTCGTSAVWPLLFSENVYAYSSDAKFLQSNPDNSGTLTAEIGASVLFDVFATQDDDNLASPVKLGNLAGSISASVTSGKLAATTSDCSLIDWTVALSTASVAIAGKSDAAAKFCYQSSAIGSYDVKFDGNFPYNWVIPGTSGVRTPSTTATILIQDTVAPVAPANGLATVGGDGNDVRFTWDAVTDSGSPISYYTFEMDNDITTQTGVGGLVLDLSDVADGNHIWHINTIDQAGNVSPWSADMNFTVDTTAPVITVLGDAVVTLEVGDIYTDAGATALDTIDGDLTSAIATSGATIDTSNIGGPYIVSYKVSDIHGNDTIAHRTVNVVARKITITADNKSKVAGEVDPSLTYQLASGSLVAGEALTGSLVRVAGETAGQYAINIGTLNNAKYEITFIPGVFTITAAPVVVPVVTPVATPAAPASDSTTTADTESVAVVEEGDINGSENSTDVKTSTDTAVKSATDTKKSVWKIIGLAWYWWLLIIAAIGSIWWWFVGTKGSDQSSSKKK